MLKRAHSGVYHKMIRKHLQRYVADFSGRHNIRCRDTLDRMRILARGMGGWRLPYATLNADNELWSGANGGRAGMTVNRNRGMPQDPHQQPSEENPTSDAPPEPTGHHQQDSTPGYSRPQHCRRRVSLNGFGNIISVIEAAIPAGHVV